MHDDGLVTMRKDSFLNQKPIKPDIIVCSTNKNLDGEMALNLNGFIDKIISFGQDNPLIALIIAIIFFFLIFRRPKLILWLLLLMLILAGVYYLIMDTASSVKNEKQRLIHESEESSKMNEK
jgi:predicted membrane protein